MAMMDENEPAWGTDWLPRLLPVLGCERTDAYMVDVSFNVSIKVLAVIYYTDGTRDDVWLAHEGISTVKELLGMPHIAQGLSINVKVSEFVMFTYRFAPEYDTLNEILLLLTEESEKETA